MEQTKPSPPTDSLRGFTLLEVLLALGLVAILSVAAITQFTDFSQDAKTAVTKERMNTIRVAIKGDARMVSNGQFVRPGFEAHCGALPGVKTGQSGATALSELITNPGSYSAYSITTKTGWRGPYLSQSDGTWSKDGWGLDFEYDPSARTLKSRGPDAQLGTADDLVITL
ncbi:MAG: prepilin-type N-terminal cleavage/methylation domain-containing protein [Bdellovibrionales bacterium]|nr:prepilin-type N-terminal cleavage/methylation domain-containing protein [Bdellovibrionales bacterium]